MFERLSFALPHSGNTYMGALFSPVMTLVLIKGKGHSKEVLCQEQMKQTVSSQWQRVPTHLQSSLVKQGCVWGSLRGSLLPCIIVSSWQGACPAVYLGPFFSFQVSLQLFHCLPLLRDCMWFQALKVGPCCLCHQPGQSASVTQ